METKTKVRHTRTPWKIVEVPCSVTGTLTWEIQGEDILLTTVRGVFGKVEWNQEAKSNAAFIVRAVNSHEALLEAAKKVRATVGKDAMAYMSALRELWEAIAQAEART